MKTTSLTIDCLPSCTGAAKMADAAAAFALGCGFGWVACARTFTGAYVSKIFSADPYTPRRETRLVSSDAPFLT